MINKDSDIEIIISRYLSKEATPEEIKVLDDWISATPENYRSFLSQKNVWEVSHPAFNPEEIDVDNAHRKVMEQDSPSKPAGFRSSQVVLPTLLAASGSYLTSSFTDIICLSLF